MKRVEEITLPIDAELIGGDELLTDLVTAIQKMGRGSLVILEGEDDCKVFDRMFRKYAGQLTFYNANGCSKVAEYVEKLLTKSSRKQIYGIIDRDYREEQEVQDSYSRTSHLFILYYHELENYLLANPHTQLDICERLYSHTNEPQLTVEQLGDKLCQIAQEIQYLTAAEWCIAEYNKDKTTERISFFSDGFPATEHDKIIHQVSQKLGIAPSDAKEKIAKKYALLDLSVKNTEQLHAIFAGKRLIHHLSKQFKGNVPIQNLKRALEVSCAKGEPHSHLRNIIEGRVLKISTT